MSAMKRFDYMISNAVTSYTKKGLSRELEIATYIETELLRLSRLNPSLTRAECADIFIVHLKKMNDYIQRHADKHSTDN